MADRNYDFSSRLIAALAALGVRHACVSPGSRSTPLTLAAAREPGLTDWIHLDERSSAFFALGMAKATRAPVLVVCTSGTAAAELLPAVVESRLGRIPLVVATADRPADLRDVGAPQTIDQRRIFGDQVLWSHDLEPPPPGESAAGFPEALAARAFAAAAGPVPGPVHLNLQFREPLTAGGDAAARRAGAVPHLAIAAPAPDAGALEPFTRMLDGKQALIVCGPQRDPHLPAAVAALAATLEAPILADPLSGLRAGTHDRSRVLAGGDLLAGAGWLDRARPEVILRIGGLPTSKPLWTWLGSHPEIPQVVIDPGAWADPDAAAARILQADPAAALAGLASAGPAPGPASWNARWREMEARARAAVDEVVAGLPFPGEPAAVAALGVALPERATLWAASSLPVRHLDLLFPSIPREIRIEANRGANGIDGFLSSGLGDAAVSGGPTYLLAGDLSALHDLTALGTAARLGIPATIVLLNNDGGGIFHLLPQHDLPEFERHFGTPHGTDFLALAAGFGVPARRVDGLADFMAAISSPPDGPRLLEVRTDRETTADELRAIRAAAREAVAGPEG